MILTLHSLLIGGPNSEYFRNRKGFFFLNVQTISSPNLKIMDVVARWTGSCHDQTIFKKSCVYSKLVSGTRNPVERSYGVLKRRFLILSFGSRLKIETTQAVIVGCCILHNLACDNNDIEPPELIGNLTSR